MNIDLLIRALADPTRLRIMRLLTQMELAVGELAQVLEQSQPRVSRHIRILCESRLTTRRKEGSWVFLKSAIHRQGASPLAATIARLLDLAEAEDQDFAAVCKQDLAHLSAIRADREAAAQAYFDSHAHEWDRLRSLHSPDAQVEAALSKALAGPLGLMLDVGTGTGRIAELLAPRTSHVTGFDKNPEMLRLARTRLQKLPADKVDLTHGDFTHFPFADGRFDTLVFHQVLHYAQEPEAALAEASRITRTGGRIAIVDFAAHDMEELRRSHAHARLGFTNSQMASLLENAGFASDQPVCLAGSPLTVTIWTATKHSADNAANHADITPSKDPLNA